MMNVITKVEEVQFVGYVTDGLKKFVFDLYTRHNMKYEGLNGMGYSQVRAEIDRLQSLPFPMSIKQRETITNLIEEIKQYKPEFDVPVEILNNLTGGQGGTASEFVAFLFEQRGELSALMPATVEQQERLYDWFYCPDIPWEDFEMVLRKPYPTELNPNGWMFLDGVEFKAQVAEKMTKAIAQEFINAHQQKFYEWKNSRINQYQIQTIRNIEARMAVMGKQGVKTYARNEDGQVVEIYRKSESEFVYNAYEPMDDYFLRQMSQQQAEKYIEQLNSERAIRQKSALETSTNQEDLNQKIKTLKKPGQQDKNNQKEYDALVDLAFKLETAGNYENVELHESIKESMVTGGTIGVKTELGKFMIHLVEEGIVGVKGLINMCDKSELAMELIEKLFPEEYDTALHGKRSDAEVGTKTKEEKDASVHKFMAQFAKK